jgi:predicted deacylase
MERPTRIFTDIDYNRNGKQIGHLYLPYSVTRSAYGNIALPIAVIGNGKGPTVFLQAGTHGDEFEGQIALCKLVRELEPSEISGRVIVMTATNLPAALAGARVSPLDGGNLNRAYPGDPDSGPTKAIAHYVDSVLFPMTDYHLDLHSGGSSLDYQPFVSMRRSDDPDLDRRAMAALMAFGGPIGIVWAHSLEGGFTDAAAIRRGIVSLGGEFGGGGAVAREAVGLVERGIRRVLAHAGIIEGSDAPPKEGETRLLEVGDRDYFALAPDAGLFEFAVVIGEEVVAEQLCGHVHFVDDPARPPVPAHFRRAGTVVCTRHFGRVERGDCLAHLATPWGRSSDLAR